MNLPNYATLKPTITLLTLALIILSLLACRKEVKGPTIIYGKVLEQGTQKPVPNALVKLVYITYYSFNAMETFLDSVRTDSSGYYEIEVDYKLDKDLMIFAKAENYFNHEDHPGHVSVPLNNVSRNITQLKNINIIPYGYCRLIGDIPQNDYVIAISPLPGYNYLDGFEYWVNNNNYVFSRVLGNMDVRMFYFKVISGVSVEHKEDTIYPIGHDTIDVVLSF